jgi:hypothetical protein
MTKFPKGEFLESVPLGIGDALLTSRPVMDGEPVNAAVTNRLPKTNDANTAYIHGLIKRFHNLSGEYLWQMPITPEVRIGDFVCYDVRYRAFKPGIAKFTMADGNVAESESSLVWGVVVNIRNDKADICTNGLCEFRPTSNAYSHLPTPGIRFLSDTLSGGLTDKVRYPYKCVGFLVGVKQSGDVQFFVRPYLAADPRVHKHRSYELSAAPAGTWLPDSNSPTAIAHVNIDVPGWLPADHAIFDGVLPKRAIFGYNPNFLKGCGWPILAPSSAGLRWQRSDMPLLATIPPEMYRIDSTTIWWLTDQIFPWDVEREYADGKTALLPGTHSHRMWLEVTNAGYDFAEPVVTTLRPGKGLYARQYPYGGTAITGDLEVGLNLVFAEQIMPEGMGYAVGNIEGLTLQKTPVVSKIRINSSVLQITNSDFFDGNHHHGALTLSDPTGVVGSELPIEATHLNGVEEVLVMEAVGLAFNKERACSLLTQLLVPYSALFTDIAVSVRLGLLVSRAGSIHDY